ncbi:MAG: alpha/beta hydrolase [Pseudomonadales bacterium]
MTATVYKSAEARLKVNDLYRAYLDSWPFAFDEHNFETDFGVTHVIESGSKANQAIVLLHGTMATAAMWREEIEALAPRYRVIAIDVIGDAGFSAPTRPPMDSDDHALWLDQVTQKLDIESFHLVGLSLGGWLATDFAARHPDQIKSLTLITPGGIADKNVIIWALPLLLLGSWGAEKVQERILGPRTEPATEHQLHVAQLSGAIFEGMKPRDGLKRFSDTELKNLKMPVLVLLGSEDVTMDSSKIRDRFEELIPHAEIRIYEGKRHFLGNQSDVISAFIANAI